MEHLQRENSKRKLSLEALKQQEREKTYRYNLIKYTDCNYQHESMHIIHFNAEHTRGRSSARKYTYYKLLC